ncbi:MAG: hypothetical protein GXO25_07865 [Euryarchaeota archaeon]|nr:hypothetical protein [Euryarchaeota archaeon]
MHEEFGVIFSIVGAVIFYAISVFVLSRKNKDISHYLFSTMTIFSGSSELLAFFEFTGTMELAHFLLKFDLSFLAMAGYFYLLFADYFREGFNLKFALVALIPTTLIIVMVHTVMIEKMIWGPYGWAGVYRPLWDLVYGVYTISYLIVVVFIFWWVRRQVTEPYIKWKLNLLLTGSIVLLIGSLINVPMIITIGRVFPIIETSLMISAVIFAVALTWKPKELYAQ